MWFFTLHSSNKFIKYIDLCKIIYFALFVCIMPVIMTMLHVYVPGDGEGVKWVLGINPAVNTRAEKTLEGWTISAISDTYLGFWHCNTILLCEKCTLKDHTIEEPLKVAKWFHNDSGEIKVFVWAAFMLFLNTVSLRVWILTYFHLGLNCEFLWINAVY